MRHGPGCSCIGSDEAILQMLVREAFRGELAEATMIASLLVPVIYAEPVALQAAQVGRALQHMAQLNPDPSRAEVQITSRQLH